MENLRNLVVVTFLVIVNLTDGIIGSKVRLSLCCPPGKALWTGSCVEDNSTFDTAPRIKTSMYDEYELEKEFELTTDDPCTYAWMASSFLKDFYVLPNGTIYAPDSEHSPEDYCLFRKPNASEYWVKVCRQWVDRADWQICCLIFAIVVMLLVLIVYSIVPELGNLHGLVFRAYITYYIACHIGTIGQQLTAGSKTYNHLFTFFIFQLHYCAGGCVLWLNVMSFNIWRTFRSLRSVESHNRDRERKKFIWYAVYACVTPALLYIVIGVVMIYVPYLHELPLNGTIILWTCAGLLTTVIFCNTILFTLTAIRISYHEKDVAHLTNGVNKHHEVDKQWFNLHVKLFLVTGCHTIMWVIWELCPTPATTVLMIVLEVVQSILILVIFICKGNVRRSVFKKVDVTFSRFKHSVRTKQVTPTTPTTPITEC